MSPATDASSSAADPKSEWLSNQRSVRNAHAEAIAHLQKFSKGQPKRVVLLRMVEIEEATRWQAFPATLTGAMSASGYATTVRSILSKLRSKLEALEPKARRGAEEGLDGYICALRRDCGLCSALADDALAPSPPRTDEPPACPLPSAQAAASTRYIA